MIHARVFSRFLLGALLVAGSADAQNLLTNGSFEEPVFTDAVSYPETIPGWTTAPETFEVWHLLQGPGADGNQYIELDVDTCTSVSQTFPTSAGKSYRVSLAFAARDTVQDNRIEVLWNGAVIGSASADGSDQLGDVQWTRYAFAAQQGGAGSSTLSIRNVDVCDGLGSLLDDVAVVEAAPPVSVPALGGWGALLLASGLMVSTLAWRRRSGA